MGEKKGVHGKVQWSQIVKGGMVPGSRAVSHRGFTQSLSLKSFGNHFLVFPFSFMVTRA